MSVKLWLINLAYDILVPNDPAIGYPKCKVGTVKHPVLYLSTDFFL